MAHLDTDLIAQAPTSKEHLLDLLFNGLDWPKPPHLDVHDVDLIDWAPAELNLDPDAIARIRSVQQLPQLTARQPFGVFIIEFEPGRLPVGALRLLVHSLVRRKRLKSAGRRALWNLQDLLFFCQMEGERGILHVVSFSEVDGRQVLRAISWESDAPPAKLELLAARLPGLAWPEVADGGDLDTWRQTWHDAFRTGYRAGIRSAAQLAAEMAEVARKVRDEVRDLLAVETDQGPLKTVWRQVRTNLREGLSEADFADMYAETMVYGLLTARVTHPEEFRGAMTHLEFANPFLDALYGLFRGADPGEVDVDEFGLLDLGELLAATDIDDVLATFGASDVREDAVVYFYEQFLDRYDPDKRKRLGAYYTPLPVVRWMVRAVDDVLKRDLQLPGGVADDTTWGAFARRTGIEMPAGVDPAAPVVRMIDPATGTGTFLLEWLRHGAATRTGDDRSATMLGMLDRMDAFEIELPGYTVANLKTSLELPRDVRGTAEPHILLADALADRKPEVLLEEDVIARQGRRAEEVKFETRHSVCIGNPPYGALPRGVGGGMVLRPNSGESLFSRVLDPASERTVFSHIAHLYNWFVYFWLWGMWKCFMQTASGPAIVTFITPNSWLTAHGFMGLRRMARELADDLYIVDLGGENRSARVDANVFGVQVGVAIGLMVRRDRSDASTPAAVHYVRIEGPLGDKDAWLSESQLDSIPWQPVGGDWYDRFVPPTGDAAWSDLPALADLLPWQQPGAKLNRTWPIAPSPEVLAERWARFVGTSDPGERATLFYTSNTGRSIHTRVAGFTRLVDLPVGAVSEPIVPYGYHAFDRQWTFRDPRLANLERPSLWNSLSAEQVFMIVPMSSAPSGGPVATSSVPVPDLCYFKGFGGGKDVIPLYRDSARTPNADPLVLEALTNTLRSGEPEAPPVNMERLFAYVYGVLAGADYAERFKEELTTPGPRIPITSNPGLFAQMVEHGEKLLWLDSFAERFRSEDREDLVIGESIVWNPEPILGPSTPRDISFDADRSCLRVGDGVLLGVAADVWDFKVSGMSVMKKWLGYRTLSGAGRAARREGGRAERGDRPPPSPLDRIRHEAWVPEWSEELRRLVTVLGEHIRLQREGTALLERIMSSDLVHGLPKPRDQFRAVPEVADVAQGALRL